MYINEKCFLINLKQQYLYFISFNQTFLNMQYNWRPGLIISSWMRDRFIIFGRQHRCFCMRFSDIGWICAMSSIWIIPKAKRVVSSKEKSYLLLNICNMKKIKVGRSYMERQCLAMLDPGLVGFHFLINDAIEEIKSNLIESWSSQ